jgi:hypothetical protein
MTNNTRVNWENFRNIFFLRFLKSKVVILLIVVSSSEGCLNKIDDRDKLLCQFSFQGKTYSSLNVKCEYLKILCSENSKDLGIAQKPNFGNWILSFDHILGCELYIDKLAYKSLVGTTTIVRSGSTINFAASMGIAPISNVELGKIDGTCFCK